MSALGWLKFWEPEETVGRAFDAASERLVDAPHFPEAVVNLTEMRGRIGVLFRGLGGAPGVIIKAGSERASEHRRGWLKRLARAQERVARPQFDGVELLLPERLDALPSRALNQDLYLWLAALAVVDVGECLDIADPLHADVASLMRAVAASRALVSAAPGLAAMRDRLYAAALGLRPPLAAPRAEAAVEIWIRAALAGAPTDLTAALADDLAAPAGYRRHRPVPVWLDWRAPPRAGAPRQGEGDDAPGSGGADEAERKLAAERRAADQANRRDNLILHRFETILSLADFLNINRAVDDDDEAQAKRAAEDADRLGVVQHRRQPKTRLKFDLDLSPEDATKETLAGKFAYPEWDWRARRLEPAQARVLENIVVPSAQGLQLDAAARRRIEAVRRRFEALRPKRLWMSRQSDGAELDLDEVVRALADRRAGGFSGDRLHREARSAERDLAVAVLFDASRSTESAVGGRSVIDIGREALVALARGLDACGDQVALYAFSSLRRDRVFLDLCKGFDEPFGARVDARIAALKPGFYTRLGAAVRHVSFRLGERPNARKLMLIITDGKPNDLDHYEGRYGLEDTRHAVQEARRIGQAVFAIAIDSQSRAHLPHLFGRSGYALTSASERLIDFLPLIYQHIVG
ncbi:MAG: VWA domain-containing protein [Pseudomonadota bacterium]|nr:VWA domain-containing protein [Pseudomonadota bacterium]